MRRFLSTLLFACTFVFLHAQPLQERIEKTFTAFRNDPQLKYGQSSLTVLNAETGTVIFSGNPDAGLAPASTLKTITSVSAFSILGDGFTWETKLGYNGTLTKGTLTGDLILKGSGDPTLGSDRYSGTKPDVLLNRWAAALKKAGVLVIEGNIIVDDLLFGTQTLPAGWVWQDIGNYYGAGASAASWRENSIGLSFRPGNSPGSPAALLRTSPEVSYLSVINEVTTGKAGTGDNVYAYSSPYSEIVYLRGTYAADLNKTIMIALPDPAFSLAYELKGKLQASGINITGNATTVRRMAVQGKALPVAYTAVDNYASPSLSKVIYWLNQKSINLYAEDILRTLSMKAKGKAGFEEGTDVITQLWKNKLGIDPNSMAILDGSGLSPENRITTLSMARILQAARKEPWFGSFYESLPVYNNMKMKSGSIRNVLCYTGYEKSSSGTPVVFSFITNNYSGSTSAIKQKMFNVLDLLK